MNRIRGHKIAGNILELLMLGALILGLVNLFMDNEDSAQWAFIGALMLGYLAHGQAFAIAGEGLKATAKALKRKAER